MNKQMVVFINFMWSLSKIKFRFNEIMRNQCEFKICLINVVGWDAFRLGKLTNNYISQ